MASRSRVSICAVLFVLACPLRGYGDKLQFTSNPSGATVELDGVAIGTTPCEKNFPGGYFHKTKTSFGARLEHPPGCAHQPHWLRHQGTYAHRRAAELAFAEWPQPWRVLALQDGSFPCRPATHFGSFHGGDRRKSFRCRRRGSAGTDRKSTRLNSSHRCI